MHDTVSAHSFPLVSREYVRAQLTEALAVLPSTAGELTQAAPERKAGRGRPIALQPPHLWLGLLWAVLEGVHGYRALARFLATHALGRFAPVSLTDSALVPRLQQAGSEPWQTLLAQLGSWLQAWLAPPACTLAPFASHILTLDETKLDAVIRHLPGPRHHRLGDPALLAGKLATVFDIRQQRWLRVRYVADALRNGKLEALALLADLPWHSLLLFDLGYFSFPLFDYLTERGYSRQGVMLDAVVWLGSDHGARAGRAVRLVRFGDGQSLRLYLTTVLDPLQLPLGDIAWLYARSFDIALAFLTIKDLFGLQQWWSSQRPLILQQIAVVLVLAQLVQALRLHLAEQAGCDPFDVSLPLLVEHLPHLLRARLNPVAWVLTSGKQQQILRPSSRYHVVAPSIPSEQLLPLPAELVLTRKAR